MDPVYFTAWLTTLLFILSRLRISKIRQFTQGLDRAGVLCLWIHIVTAYGWTHAWSHARAVQHVAERTEQTIGIPSGLGVYVNFVTATLWTYFALRTQGDGTSYSRLASEIFLWLLFISASVFFAKPVSAIVFGVAWTALGLHRLWSPHENDPQ